METSDSQKTLLAKLYYQNSPRYRQKLDELGIPEEVIFDSIQTELKRIRSLKEIKEANYSTNTKPSGNKKTNKSRKDDSSDSRKKENRNNEFYRILILVDGDNHPKKNMNGYHNVKNRRDTKIEIFAADRNLCEKYSKEFNVTPIMVPPGDQAVDNRIKALVGDKAQKHEYDKIVIISQDKGYQHKIKEWKQKYKPIDIVLNSDFTNI